VWIHGQHHVIIKPYTTKYKKGQKKSFRFQGYKRENKERCLMLSLKRRLKSEKAKHSGQPDEKRVVAYIMKKVTSKERNQKIK